MRGHDRIRGCDEIQTSIDDQRADGDGSGHCECDSSCLGQCQEMTPMEVRMELTDIAEPFGVSDSVVVPDCCVDEQVQTADSHPNHVGACPNIIN